jgi:uncharacterized OB-fold protein
MAELSVPCPHCAHATNDAFETMTRDGVDWTHCGSCQEKFFYLLACCDACGEESTFSWRKRSTPFEAEPLRCNSCGHVFQPSDGAPLSDASLRI